MKTLNDLLQNYLDHIRSLRQSDETVRKNEWFLRSFLDWLRENTLLETADRLLPVHLRKWHTVITHMTTGDGAPAKATYINRHFTAVRGWLRYLIRQGLLNADMIECLPRVKEPKHLPGSVLTHDQMRKLLVRLPTRTPQDYCRRAMMELLYSTGLRVRELLGINLDSVDYGNQTILVTGKGDKQRLVPLGRSAMKYLESYVVAVRPFLLKDQAERALFLNREGKRMGYERFRLYVHDAASKAGIEIVVTPHTFRRSCATELVRGGANLYHVKELLGHESMETLKHYTKLTIVDLKKTHEKCHPRERENRE
jgi:integrase/recombinase XerD